MATRLSVIRRRYEEYSPDKGGPTYRAFIQSAQGDMGALLDMIDLLRRACDEALKEHAAFAAKYHNSGPMPRIDAIRAAMKATGE